jgi:hypothetical protein
VTVLTLELIGEPVHGINRAPNNPSPSGASFPVEKFDEATTTHSPHSRARRFSGRSIPCSNQSITVAPLTIRSAYWAALDGTKKYSPAELRSDRELMLAAGLHQEALFSCRAFADDGVGKAIQALTIEFQISEQLSAIGSSTLTRSIPPSQPQGHWFTNEEIGTNPGASPSS